MAEYIHEQSGVRVSVSDEKELGVGFAPVDEKSKPKTGKKSD